MENVLVKDGQNVVESQVNGEVGQIILDQNTAEQVRVQIQKVYDSHAMTMFHVKNLSRLLSIPVVINEHVLNGDVQLNDDEGINSFKHESISKDEDKSFSSADSRDKTQPNAHVAEEERPNSPPLSSANEEHSSSSSFAAEEEIEDEETIAKALHPEKHIATQKSRRVKRNSEEQRDDLIENEGQLSKKSKRGGGPGNNRRGGRPRKNISVVSSTLTRNTANGSNSVSRPQILRQPETPEHQKMLDDFSQCMERRRQLGNAAQRMIAEEMTSLVTNDVVVISQNDVSILNRGGLTATFKFDAIKAWIAWENSKINTDANEHQESNTKGEAEPEQT
ncbi:hypothetical protein G9A89_009875 [Geosiphon pyriformis]|nr:hypothetical protein G9A89_009875 [Geosiphon pyriformis]